MSLGTVHNAFCSSADAPVAKRHKITAALKIAGGIVGLLGAVGGIAGAIYCATKNTNYKKEHNGNNSYRYEGGMFTGIIGAAGCLVGTAFAIKNAVADFKKTNLSQASSSSSIKDGTSKGGISRSSSNDADASNGSNAG